MQLSQLSQNTKVGIAAGCLVLAGIIMYFTVFRDMMGGGGGFSGDDKIYLLCTNQKCNAEIEMTQASFQKLMESAQGTAGAPMMMMGPMALTCKQCNQKTAYIATKCPNPKCGALFIPPNPMMGQMTNDYPDRCPECKFSQIEEDSKNAPK